MIRTGILTADQIKKLADNYMHQTLADLEQDRTEAVSNTCDIDDQIELLQEHEADYREALANNDLKRVSKITDSLIEDNQLGEVSTKEYAALAGELLKRSVEILQIEQQRLIGNYKNCYDDRVIDTQVGTHRDTAPETPTVKESPKLSDMIEKFMQDQHRKASANANTLREYVASCQLFLRIIGDLPVSDISRDTG